MSTKSRPALKILTNTLGLLAAGMSSFFFLRVRSERQAGLSLPKMFGGSTAAFVAALGGFAATLGAFFRSPLAMLSGGLGALAAARYVQRTTVPHSGLAGAFGPDWPQRISPEQRARMTRRRWSWKLAGAPEARCTRDLAFWTIPGSERRLLCDVWQPPANVPPSGLAFLYFHGSGWHFSGKDVGTRWFFRHLAAQGHVVMDVAYRLCPETNLYGMVGDVKRAIAWIKANAGQYGVDPEKVVAAGGSAGGHLALLAAYTPGHPALTPEDVRRSDTSVRAVVSYYGPADMRAYHEHAGIALPSQRKPKRESAGLLDRLIKRTLEDSAGRFEGQDWGVSHPEMMTNLLGGQPDEVPEIYALASPISHAGPHSPPTLLFQGEHDALVPVEATRALYQKLLGAGVPVVYVEFPQTEHAFDVVLPQFSPPTQAALYDLERFLALL